MSHTTLPSSKHIWQQGKQDDAEIEHLASDCNIHPAIAAILLQRGFTEPAEIEKFLHPTLTHLPSPFDMKHMTEAAEFLVDVIAAGKPIAIFGDYDVDGITGCAVLSLFLQMTGARPIVEQPNRLKNGYGLNIEAVRKLAQKCGLSEGKRGVLITVDCGISDHEEIEKAKELGFTVVVTDHHQPPPELPAADYIINPLQTGCAFPFKYLAGVGVAFYLIIALRSLLRQRGAWQTTASEPNLKDFLDLVAIGTVCDMVPLTGPNRVLVKAGLEVLKSSSRPGVLALISAANVDQKLISSIDIGYRLGPRINAAGRIGNPKKALDLLLTDEHEKGAELAQFLENENNKRKKLSDDLYEQTRRLAANKIEEGSKTIVLWDKDWHVGVLGIVASRLIKEFHRPAILLTLHNGVMKGSGRSIDRLNLFEILTSCECIENFGGHEKAAGLSVNPESIEEFAEEFEEIVRKTVTDDTLFNPVIHIDWQMTGEEIFSQNFLDNYQKLAPFGIKNPEPVFTLSNCVLENSYIVGGHHLKFVAQKNGVTLEGIGFGFGSHKQRLTGGEVNLAFALQRNVFRNKESWQANLIDFENLSL